MAWQLGMRVSLQARKAMHSSARPSRMVVWAARSLLVILHAAIMVAMLAGCGDEPLPTPVAAPAPTAQATTLAITPAAGTGTSTPAAGTATSTPAAGTATSTPAQTQPPSPITPTQTPFREINFTGVITLTNVPSQVQVVFSLRDEEGHAIVLPAEEIENAAGVYERALGEVEWGDWEEIDYTETSFFVHTAENFRLEIVFVLDFTNSMALAKLPDGRSGIDAMIAAFESAVIALPGAHRIGVVEFHDRNVEPSVLSPLTIDRESVLSEVRLFAQSRFDHGCSRVWDSLVAGSDLFSSDDDVARTLVFLSDGRDTSSEHSRESAAWYAGGRKVQLYALGVGDIYEETGLRAAALQTGGSYYKAQQVDELEDQLKILVGDLRGQYKISYISLRRTGMYQARINLELRGVEGTFETEQFDVTQFFGPDDRGVAQSDPASVDRTSEKATLFMRATHVPRNIDLIRFRLDTQKPVTVELVSGEDGGLLEGWTLTGPDSEGFYQASSGEPIEFGNFGPLFRLTLSDVTEERLSIPVSFDNSMYAGGKGFSHPLPITIGQHLWMYWADVYSGKIQRAKLDGSGVEDVVTRQPQPYGIALDTSSGKMYWADVKSGKIQRANLDGSGIEDLVTEGEWLDLVALDVAGGKMYWADRVLGKIQRANLDGSGIEDLVTGLRFPSALALDVAAGGMYWADLGTGRIQRASLDGSGAIDLATGSAWPIAIALEID